MIKINLEYQKMDTEKQKKVDQFISRAETNATRE